LRVGAEVIEVDDPYGKVRNREAFVFPIFSHKTADAKLYERGVSVEMYGALRDFRGKKWKAQHIQGHGNVMLVTCPLLPKGMTNSSDIAQRNHNEEESVVMGRANALGQWDQLPEDNKLQKHLIVFPPGMNLCNKPFQSSTFSGVPGVDIDYRISSPRSLTGWVIKASGSGLTAVPEQPVYNYESTVVWKLIDTNTLQSVTGPKKKTNVDDDKLDDLDAFAAFNIEDDGE